MKILNLYAGIDDADLKTHNTLVKKVRYGTQKMLKREGDKLKKDGFIMECLKCGYAGDFVGKTRVCTHCFTPNATSKYVEHFRICYSCFKVDKVSTKDKARATYCRSCSSRIRNTKDLKDLVRYKYTCEGCGEQRVLKAPTNAVLCKLCSSKLKNNAGKTFKRVCEGCGISEDVRVHPSTRKDLCVKCQKIKTNLARYRGAGTKKDKKYKKVYQQVGVDGAKRNKVTVKFQIVDENTMAAPVKKRKQKEFPLLNEDVSMKMQNEWIKNNKIKVG